MIRICSWGKSHFLLGLSFPNCKLRGLDWVISTFFSLLQTLAWKVIFHQGEGDWRTHLESECVSVQGAVLIYGDESVKGDHLPLIYVRGMLCSWLLLFWRSWGWSRGSFWDGYERGGEEEAVAWWGQQWWGHHTFTECLLPAGCGNCPNVLMSSWRRIYYLLLPYRWRDWSCAPSPTG